MIMISISGLLRFIGTLSIAVLPICARSTERQPKAQVETIPAKQSNLDSIATFTSTSLGLDSQHVHPINASAWEWYYFDAVSPDGKQYVSVIMYTAPQTGFFGGGPPEDIIISSLFASTPSNPNFYFDDTFGTEAVVTSLGNGASGDWKGTGFEFTGSPDLSTYSIQINSPQINLKGSLKLKSIAPPHYPCGPMQAGEKLEVMPYIGWANAIPDAEAEVDMMINGTKVKFSGVGYHDKNWSNRPFTSLVASWVWGHARVGPYSVVFWDGLDPKGREHTSAYVACDGHIITVSCSGVKVRPTSKGAVYPPTIGSPVPTSFHVEINLGDRGMLAFDIHSTSQVWSSTIYDRWTGKTSGGIKGQKEYTGVSVYEEFVFTPSS